MRNRGEGEGGEGEDTLGCPREEVEDNPLARDGNEYPDNASRCQIYHQQHLVKSKILNQMMKGRKGGRGGSGYLREDEDLAHQT